MKETAVTPLRTAAVLVAAALVLALVLAGSGASAGGDLDLSFDGDGRVITAPGGDGSGQANAVVIQADGKIVAGGLSSPGPGIDATVVRYKANGSLDPTFGTGGVVKTQVSGADRIYALAMQSDGKIVAAGHAPGVDAGFVLFRYLPNGSLDPGFGIGGIAQTSFGPDSEAASSVAIQVDGKIVAGGVYADGFALARYDTSGSLDPSFGSGGKVVTNFGVNVDYGAVALGLQNDGRIVAAGTYALAAPTSAFLVVRYTTNGTLDSTFGTGGFETYDPGPEDAAEALGIQADGKIVVGGKVGPYPQDFALLRLDPDGSPDSTFGTAGWVVTDFGGGTYDAAKALAIQIDGAIVAAGISSSSGGEDFALARYEPNTGSLDPSFGAGGLVTTDMGSDKDEAQAIALQPDGRIVVAGRVVIPIPATVKITADWGLARYHSGLPDHYECYEVEQLGEGFSSRDVTLADQFLSERATVKPPIGLCNPVDKNGEGIRRPEGHLTCYSIAPSTRPAKRTVLVSNQFGSAQLTLGAATRLCLPASKVPLGTVGPGPVPGGLDHYKCYAVTDGDPFEDRIVALEDQFGALDVVALEPVEVCNPADKNGEGIENDEVHQVCYAIEDVAGPGFPSFSPRTVATRDQFGTLTLKALRPQVLCLPSAKQVVRG